MQLLEVRMQYELNDMESPEGGGGGGEHSSAHPTPGASPQTSGPPSHPSTSSNNSDGGNIPCLKYETHIHTHKHLHKLSVASGELSTHSHTHSCTQGSCLSPQALLHRLSQRLKDSQPQPPHHPPLAATHARPSTHNCFRAAAAPLVILSVWNISSFSLRSVSFSLSPSPPLQSAQHSPEAVPRLPGRFGGPVSVGERRASSADHKSRAQFLLRPVSIQTAVS